MKLLYPDLYEEMRQMEDPEIKKLEKEMRDFENDMLKDLYS